MYSLRPDKVILKYEGKRAVIIGELNVDSSADLPAYDAIPGFILAQGSIAWDISTGDFYGLNSSGVWIKQTGSEESAGE